MTDDKPIGVHRLADVYSPNVHGSADGRSYFLAPAEPYTGNRLVAAWWVLTGRAFAFIWPELGELEEAISREPVRNPRA